MKIFEVASYSTRMPVRWPLATAGDAEEGGHVRDPRRLLHVVRDDHDRVLLLQLVHQVLDPGGRDQVEGRRRLVHENHLWLDRETAGDAQPLLLTPDRLSAP